MKKTKISWTATPGECPACDGAGFIDAPMDGTEPCGCDDGKIYHEGATFNLVWGCTKVSPGCAHCYAETLAKRYKYDVWGKNTERRPMSENYWKQPLKWNKQVDDNGDPVRTKVFCGSMCDVFEEHPDLRPPRWRLFRNLIPETPNLDWLLLTKRPENILSFLPSEWRAHKFGRVPHNVWLGTSAENQEYFDRRSRYMQGVDYLAQPSVIFFSIEPMLGPIDISSLKNYDWSAKLWIICGGESQRGCRPMDEDWARRLRDQCGEMDIPFFYKQRGGTEYIDGVAGGHLLDGKMHWNWPQPERIVK